MNWSRSWLCSLVMLAPTGVACDSDDEAPKTVMLSGTAYGFNTPNAVTGAVIRILEVPGSEATTSADASWTLEVPAKAEVTPYITHPDHITMHLETFDLSDSGGSDFEHVNFQMVAPDTYELLAAVLQITPDPTRCQIAATVSEKAIQTISYDEFRAHGAHGVAGATVAITPASAEVVYFNEQVIPQRNLTERSRDGGVVWANVPPGRYTLHATHATQTFADVTVSCEAGRFVNANPPQGIREF